MIKRRAADAGPPLLPPAATFCATGITAYLENGGTSENAQAIAAHESPRTTKLYDRTSDEITLDEVERIGSGSDVTNSSGEGAYPWKGVNFSARGSVKILFCNSGRGLRASVAPSPRSEGIAETLSRS
jgi:hypothetical protein